MSATTTLSTMTILSEYEVGAFAGRAHPHNGYYAGDFGCRNGRSTKARTTATQRTQARTTLPRR
jgi:hypothetical protein